MTTSTEPGAAAASLQGGTDCSVARLPRGGEMPEQLHSTGIGVIAQRRVKGCLAPSARAMLACLSVLLAPLAYAQTYSRTEVIEYHDDLATYVLGQTRRTICAQSVPAHGACDGQADSVMSEMEYGWKALPWKAYSFGKLQETFTYETSSTDQLGTLKTSTDGNGNVTSLTSWKRGIPQSIKYPPTPEASAGATQIASVDNNGWITQITDETASRTCYGYDSMGRITSITYPSEATANTCNTSTWLATTTSFVKSTGAKYGLPAGHWQQTVSTGAGRKIVYLDALWRPVVAETFDNTNSTVASATRSVTVTRYDSAGRRAFQSYPMASLSNYAASTLTGSHSTYDALSRPVQVKQDWEGTGQLTTTTEYLPEFLTRVTNPRGYRTVTRYMTWDQPTHDYPVIIDQGSGTPEASSVDITRDPFGKTIALRKRDRQATIALTRTYTYNAHQELCRSVEPETGATLMGYDGAGNLTWSASGLPAGTACHATGNTTAINARKASRTYDRRNWLRTLSFPDGLGNTTSTYTVDGLLASIMADNGGSNQVTTSYVYNRRRMLTGEGMAWNTISYSLGYGYNANGHLATQTYPVGGAIGYAPNALGQPTQAGTYATGVKYHPNGGIKEFTYGNGIRHTLVQNARGLPDTSCDFYGSCNASAFLNDGYDYDQNGNVAAISDGRTGNRGNRTMTYDGLDRLTRTVSPMFGTATYAYDALDNMTRVKLTGGNQIRDHWYCYDDIGAAATWRLTNIKASSCSGATVMGLGYDAQGNLVNRNGRTYTFDFGNRLRQASASGSTPATTYVYDGHGRRVRDVTGASRYSLYGLDGKLYYTRDDRTGLRSNYIYLGGSLVAIRDRDSALAVVGDRYQHTDALGSSVAVTSATRAVLERTEYEPYGRPANRSWRDGVGYTGHVEDAATDLTYMQQRYYDPMIGRFLSTDPVSPIDMPPSLFNRYTYAYNNPYIFLDPDGRQATEATEEAPPPNEKITDLETITVTPDRSAGSDGASQVRVPSLFRLTTFEALNRTRSSEQAIEDGNLTRTVTLPTLIVSGGTIATTPASAPIIFEVAPLVVTGQRAKEGLYVVCIVAGICQGKSPPQQRIRQEERLHEMREGGRREREAAGKPASQP